eukprot:14075415-Alexandrium_andersonii.AAC.1
MWASGAPTRGCSRWTPDGTSTTKLKGSRKTTLAARYPPALRVAILRGIAAQHAREGRTLPGH